MSDTFFKNKLLFPSLHGHRKNHRIEIIDRRNDEHLVSGVDVVLITEPQSLQNGYPSRWYPNTRRRRQSRYDHQTAVVSDMSGSWSRTGHLLIYWVDITSILAPLSSLSRCFSIMMQMPQHCEASSSNSLHLKVMRESLKSLILIDHRVSPLKRYNSRRFTGHNKSFRTMSFMEIMNSY